MAKRLTAAARRERNFWLGCAEVADDFIRGIASPGAPRGWPFLCHMSKEQPVEVRDRLGLFQPAYGGSVWWVLAADYEDKYVGSGRDRVLAACFLAAMAELGE